MGKSLHLGISKRWASESDVPVGEREEQAEATSRSQQRSETAYQSRLSVQDCPRQRPPRQRHTHVIHTARERLEPLESGRVTDQEQGVRRATRGKAAGRSTRGLAHRLGHGVDADEQRFGLAARGVQHGTTVTRAEVDDQWPRTSDQAIELPDVQLEESTTDHATHGGHRTRWQGREQPRCRCRRPVRCLSE